jgi:hypothetical protein
MSFAFIQDVPIDDHEYAEVREGIGPDVPKGLTVHLVIRQGGGLRYIDVWDSEADWERFRDGRVDPAVRQMMATHGLTPPTTHPAREEIDVVDCWLGSN